MKQLLIIAFAVHSFNILAQSNLEYYISTAQQNSPLINDTKNMSAVNALELERLKAIYRKPQVGVTAGYLFSPIISTDNNKTTVRLNADNATNYYGYDLANSNGGLYQAMLNVTQPLFNGKSYKTASELYTVASQISDNTTKLTEHDLEKFVTDQYILCLQDLKQIEFSELMIDLLNDQKDILTKLVQSSIYKQSDLMLLMIESQTTEAQLTTFKANYYRDLMDLNILSGINDTKLVQIEPIELVLNTDKSQSAFLEKYRLDSLNLIAQQRVLNLKYKPQLNFFANTGLSAVYAPTVPNRFGFSAGLSFSYNFFDGNQKSINRNKALLLTQTVSFYKSNFVTQNTLRKSKIITELASYTDRLAIAEEQLKEYKLLLNSYKMEIVSGELSIINYVAILKNMVLIQRDYTLLLSQKQSLINTYNYWNW